MIDRKRELAEILSEIEKEIEPEPRRPRSVEKDRELHRRQSGKCALCGEPVKLLPDEYEVDHRIPLSRGGGNELPNLQITHRICNRRKGNQVDMYEQLDYLDDKHQ